MKRIVIVALAAALFVAPGVASAKVLSKSTANVTQVKIVHGGAGESARTSSWGIDSTYIGPGDVNRLVSIDVYLDGERRIAAVKVVRQTVVGDTVTLLFSDVRELSVQTLGEGATRPHHPTPITVRTADDLSFP
jgi:hypothetical protein